MSEMKLSAFYLE